MKIYPYFHNGYIVLEDFTQFQKMFVKLFISRISVYVYIMYANLCCLLTESFVKLQILLEKIFEGSLIFFVLLSLQF